MGAVLCGGAVSSTSAGLGRDKCVAGCRLCWRLAKVLMRCRAIACGVAGAQKVGDRSKCVWWFCSIGIVRLLRYGQHAAMGAMRWAGEGRVTDQRTFQPGWEAFFSLPV